MVVLTRLTATKQNSNKTKGIVAKRLEVNKIKTTVNRLQECLFCHLFKNNFRHHILFIFPLFCHMIVQLPVTFLSKSTNIHQLIETYNGIKGYKVGCDDELTGG